MIGKRKSTIHASFWDAFKAGPLRAGIPAELAHPHSLKHTSGTKTLELLGDFYLVKEHLGHRSIQSTEVCARVTGKTREERADRLHDWKWFSIDDGGASRFTSSMTDRATDHS